MMQIAEFLFCSIVYMLCTCWLETTIKHAWVIMQGGEFGKMQLSKMYLCKVWSLHMWSRSTHLEALSTWAANKNHSRNTSYQVGNNSNCTSLLSPQFALHMWITLRWEREFFSNNHELDIRTKLKMINYKISCSTGRSYLNIDYVMTYDVMQWACTGVCWKNPRNCRGIAKRNFSKPRNGSVLHTRRFKFGIRLTSVCCKSLPALPPAWTCTRNAASFWSRPPEHSHRERCRGVAAAA